MNRHTNVPMTREEVASLKAGDYVYPTGTIYTARDATHKWIDEALDRGETLLSDIEGSIMHYMEPSPTREGRPTGSTGPAAASRVDKYTSRLLDLDTGTMIGKGKRSRDIVDATVRGEAVYSAAVGGTGAILPKYVLSPETAAYGDLGMGTVRRLIIQDFPVVVVMDILDNSLYETAVRESCTLQQEDMKRIMYMVLMNLLHAPMWLFTITHMAREESTRTATEKYGYMSEMVKRINKRGRATVTVTGTEYIPSGDGFILFPNHQGLFDMLTLLSTYPRSLSVAIEKGASNWILIK